MTIKMFFGKIFKGVLLYNKPTLLYAIVKVWAVVGFLPLLPSAITYSFTIAFAFYFAIHGREFDKITSAFLLYIPINLLIVNPDVIFQPWLRYGLFVCILFVVSPLVQSKWLRDNRLYILNITMWACVILGVGSFFAFFLGINFMIIPKEYEAFADLNAVGLFAGLTNHSMMLGPIAGIGACFMASKAVNTKKKIYWIFVALALGSVLFSASRSAFAAAIAGVTMTLYKQSGSTSRFVGIGVTVILLLSMTFTLWSGALTGVLEKNRGTSLNFDSRSGLWDKSLDEFESNPIFGVGFCSSSDVSSVSKTGTIESGSSWLNVLSMLGLVGSVFVAIIMLKALYSAYKRNDEYGALLFGVLVLFYIHMMAEGYIFAGGSFLAFMLWLTVGVSIDTNYVKDK
jgi:hypothetical protein